MRRPLWLRIALQVGLAAVLGYAVILLATLLGAHLSASTMALARRVGMGPNGIYVFVLLRFAAPMLVGGALAAVLSWLLLREPWDGLGACAVLALWLVVTGMTYSPKAVAFRALLWWWWWVGLIAAEVVAVFAGYAIVAWLIQRRAGAKRHEQAAD